MENQLNMVWLITRDVHEPPVLLQRKQARKTRPDLGVFEWVLFGVFFNFKIVTHSETKEAALVLCKCSTSESTV